MSLSTFHWQAMLEESIIEIVIVAPTPALRAGVGAMLVGPGLRIERSLAMLPDGALLPAHAVVVVADESLLGQAVRVGGNQQLAIVVLAADSRPIGQLQALGLRAWGIVPPDAAAAELQAAVQATAQGLIVVPAALGTVWSEAHASLPSEPLNEPLTAREHEVLELLAQGLANKQIARKLAISEHTVKFHVSAVYSKLGAASRTDAVSRGARRGLITL